MDAITAIKTRKSIRKFTGEVITEEKLKIVLEAAFSAPTANDFQSWEFIVVRDKEKLRKIADLHPYAKMFPEAGCGIIVCGNKDKQELLGFLAEDCAAAIENILIAANSEGLGAVWCGIYPMDKIVKEFENEFDLPVNIVPIGIVAIGNPGEKKDVVDRFDSEKIHYDRW